MITKEIENEILSNIAKNDAAARSNTRLIDLLRKQFKLKENQFLSDRRLKSFKADIQPIIAKKYKCTLEDGRQGLKYVGKKAPSARKAQSRICSYVTAPPTPPTPFELALKAVADAVEDGMTDKQAEELIALIK